jgi:hypothetical protein
LNAARDRAPLGAGEMAALYSLQTHMATDKRPGEAVMLPNAVDRPADDEHDRGLIVERLSWTPEQRLEANTAFLRFYLAARPEGPLIRDE